MKYGLPYKGSKNKLAERIVSLLPPRAHLIDLFCGGCAVSHAALLTGKYRHVHINDINWMCPNFFLNVVEGHYQNETRWISREMFYQFKDVNPYISFVWSFGNNMRDYMYARDVEKFKRALHYAVYFKDYSDTKALGYDLSFLSDINNINDRYLAVKHLFRNDKCRLQELERSNVLNDIYLSCLSHIVGDGQTNRRSGRSILTASTTDYATVTIPDDSVIYCDIPYFGTNVYNPIESFDYNRFYDWAVSQKHPVFISSYDMPSDRFRCIAQFLHRSTISATANNMVIERIFVPINQQEQGNIINQFLLEL